MSSHLLTLRQNLTYYVKRISHVIFWARCIQNFMTRTGPSHIKMNPVQLQTILVNVASSGNSGWRQGSNPRPQFFSRTRRRYFWTRRSLWSTGTTTTEKFSSLVPMGRSLRPTTSSSQVGVVLFHPEPGPGSSSLSLIARARKLEPEGPGSKCCLSLK